MIEIRPLQQCDSVVTIHGSKSYTHRALIVSALAEGESVLLNALRSEDTEHTLQGLRQLGISVSEERETLRVAGQGGRLREEEETLSLGNSGTSMRFLTALSALKKGRTILDGNERMRKRPMAGLLEGLRALGVEAGSIHEDGCAPVTVESRGLKGGTARIRGDESSQFLSALLMVAPYAKEDITVEVAGRLSSRPYVDITLDVMSSFGVEVQRYGDRAFSVQSGQRYRPREYLVEGDASNASYFFAAAAITRGRIRVENFRPESAQGDRRFLDVLERMGCEVVRAKDCAALNGKKLRGIEVDMNAMPDLVPTLAITAAFAEGRTVIQNVAHLRFKESDRIAAVTGELLKMGVRTEEGQDWLAIEGGNPHGALIETHDDHRIAMSFAVAGLAVPGVRIQEERCVDKSFPGFWETLEMLRSGK
jgi:3-phosphoshikimate 1-carboxyvinyltransferase